MAPVASSILLLAAACVPQRFALSLGNSSSPVEKVVTLLEDLQAQVESEGQSEAAVYAEFSCFCKDSSNGKSGAITLGQDRIDTVSANIQADTASQAEKASDVSARQTMQGELSVELEATRGRCLKESAEFEANVADLTKAVTSLDKAVKAMGSSKQTGDALLSLKESRRQSLTLDAALSLIKEPKRAVIRSFLQQGVDPSSPDYEYKSQGIIDTLEKLLSDFTAKKTETQTEWETATKVCENMQKSLSDEMESNDKSIRKLNEDIDTLKTGIAMNRESLVQTEGNLKDDQVYLKDVTGRCEARAKVWDQRTALRKNELEALAGALAILTGKVQPLDTAVNVRALMVQRKAAPRVAAPALLQEDAQRAPPRRHLALVSEHGRRVRRGAVEARGERARELLSQEGARLSSPVLSALAERVAADPFAEVKGLIQKLIERLLQESTQEATKKGYCDEQLANSHNSRDSRHAEAAKLSSELGQLEAKKDDLTLEIASLKEASNSTSSALGAAMEERSKDHAVNMETLAKAREGLKAVTDAITILKNFYKSAAKAKVLLQESPIEADDPGAGFDGVYKGQQEASTGIFGLLEVVKSDFDRTVRTTESGEKTAAADFVDFDRASRASIAEKEKGRELSEQDLGSIETAITQKMADLEAAQNMVDSALKAIEDLKPMCIDNVMTFAERTAKRQEEIAALKTALCYLDPEQVEDECKN